jgi:hypothetical protein
MQGCTLLIKLAQLLQETGTAHNWNLVHLVLVEGEDGGSETESAQIHQTMHAISQLLHVKMVKIVVIALAVAKNVESELRNIVKAAGCHAEYHDIRDGQICTVFEKIMGNLGLEKRKQTIRKDNNRSVPMEVFLDHRKFISH